MTINHFGELLVGANGVRWKHGVPRICNANFVWVQPNPSDASKTAFENKP